MTDAKRATAWLLNELEQMRDELLGDIDGAEECRGRDARLTRHADLVERAIRAIKAGDKFASSVDDALNSGDGAYRP